MRGKFINGDCMEYLPKYEDNHFDLAIVDPPYGQVWGNLADITSGNKKKMKNFYKQTKAWDFLPNKDYFKELSRVSKERLIFGYNYFTDFIGPTNDLIVWDKLITGNEMFLRFELIYSSRNTSKIFRLSNSKLNKVHPTQKPIALYKWLLKNYAKEGDLILDTHVGSASSLIACEDMGFEYVGYELDKDYYQAASKRLENHLAQLKIF